MTASRSVATPPPRIAMCPGVAGARCDSAIDPALVARCAKRRASRRVGPLDVSGHPGRAFHPVGGGGPVAEGGCGDGRRPAGSGPRGEGGGAPPGGRARRRRGEPQDRHPGGDWAVAEGQAQLLAEVIRVYFDAVGVPLDARARKLLGGLLRQLSEGEPLAPSPEYAVEARRELVAALAEQVRERLPDLEPEWERREPPGLPAPSVDD